MIDKRLVAFLSGGQVYAVPISEVMEVIDAAGVERIPGCQPPLEGLMMHRGKQVLPVFNLPRASHRAPANAGRLIMIVRAPSDRVGIRLERVLGIYPVPEEGLGPLPADMSPALRSIGRGGLAHKGGALVVLDVAKALSPTRAEPDGD